MRTIKQIVAAFVVTGALAGWSGQILAAPAARPAVEAPVANAPDGPPAQRDGPKPRAEESRNGPDKKEPKPKDPKPKDPHPKALSEVLRASTTSAYWYGDMVGLPASFDVVVSGDVITFGPCAPTAILIQTATSLFAQPCGANVQIVDDAWTYSGLLGEAAGTIQ